MVGGQECLTDIGGDEMAGLAAFEMPFDRARARCMDASWHRPSWFNVIFFPTGGEQFGVTTASNTDTPGWLNLRWGGTAIEGATAGAQKFSDGFSMSSAEISRIRWRSSRENSFRSNASINSRAIVGSCDETACWMALTGDEEANIVKKVLRGCDRMS